MRYPTVQINGHERLLTATNTYERLSAEIFKTVPRLPRPALEFGDWIFSEASNCGFLRLNQTCSDLIRLKKNYSAPSVQMPPLTIHQGC